MLAIQYPEPAFRVKKQDGADFIFDPLRKKWLLLTPEEWVRLNFVQYLVQVKRYPAELIALEKKIRLGELTKRFDILVYDKQHQPRMMIECKASAVRLDETVLHQLLRYHLSVPVSFLVITNGEFTCGWQKKAGNLQLIEQIPDWADFAN